MIQSFVRLIAVFFFSFTAFYMYSQSVPFKLYTTHDGLPQSQILCLFQDSRGYIWMGTQGGLSVFNGSQFKNILPTDGLPFNVVPQIQEDSKGNIWFSTVMWMCKYDGQHVAYDTFRHRSDLGIFFIDKSDNFWTISAKDKMIYHSKDAKKWLPFTDVSSNIKNLKWETMVYDKQNDRLLIENEEKEVYQLKDNKLSFLFKGDFSLNSYFHFSSNCFKNTVVKNDSIFDLTGNQLRFVTKSPFKIADIIKAKDGSFYAYKANENNNTLFRFDKNNKIDSIPLNLNINILFEDKDQNIWVGTEQGLVRLYINGFQNFSKKELNGIWSMVEDTEGGMYFGSFFDRNLKRYDGHVFKEINLDKNIFKQIEQSKNEDFYFYFGGGRDTKGNLYFPMSWGVMRYDGKVFTRLDKAKVPVRLSMNLYVDTSRDVIISGALAGFNIIDIKNGSTKFIGKEKGFSANGYVLGIDKDMQGRYWLSGSKNIDCYDIEKDTIVKSHTNKNGKLKYYAIQSIKSDIKGGIWAGSAQGLLRYDAQKDSFIRVASETIKSAISALTVYKNEYLVISASDGIHFLDLKAFYTKGGKIIVRSFNQHNGYLGIEPNQNCLYIDSKNNIWVSATDIVTKITPSELDMTLHPLKPYITQINDTPILYENYNTVISLPRGLNIAKIRFEAVGFERPFETEFSYKLNDGKWSDWQKDDFAVIDNLSSGHHKFYVRTRPAGTIDEKKIAQTHIQFHIDLPFHEEPNFPLWVLGASLIVIGMGIFLYYDRKRKMREVQKQHAMDTERQKELELLNNEMSHRVRNNLGMMQQIMSMQARRIQNDDAKKIIKEGGDRILAMSILHDYLIAQKGVEFLEMKGYIQDLCEKVKMSYGEMTQDLTFDTDFEDIRLNEIFGRHIGLIISELLTNSLKYAFHNTLQARIRIQLSEKNGTIVLIYNDNGCGLPVGIDINQTKTLGLKLIKGIIERLKGQIQIENRGGFYCQINFTKPNA